MTQKSTVYHPPAPKVIEDYAKEVCNTLAEKGGESYTKPEVSIGLARFLNLLAYLTAKHLNKGHHQGNRIKIDEGR